MNQNLSTTSGPLLEVKDLTVEFPAGRGRWVTAVENVSFTLNAGESMALVGESGSGKTVTSLAVMGLTSATGGRISTGEVVFDGTDLRAAPEKVWKAQRGPGMGMIFQQPIRSLNPAYTVGNQIAENVRKHLGVDRRTARARAIEMLDLVKIPRAAERFDEYPHQLSGGMCQRVMIAMVMAVNPRLLIADEPTTALDVTVQKRILDLLRELQEQTNVALLFISHDLGVVADLCEKVAVLYSGEMVETGSAADVFFRPRHPYTSGLLGSIPKPPVPGIALDRRLKAIPGAIPASGAWPGGCRFADRCGFVEDRCRQTHPAMVEVGPDVSARCHRVEEIELEGVTLR